MNFKKLIMIPLLSVAVLLMGVSYVFALSGDEYTTPDSWSKHTTPNGVKSSSGGISLSDSAILTMGLTTRYQLRVSDDYDSDLYQYFRAHLKDTSVGQGTAILNVNMRIGGDINRPYPRDNYDFFLDGLDAELHSADVALRIYQANLVLDNVVKHTKLTLGRFYLNYIDSLKMDGGKLYVGNDEYGAYAFYGLPVSFYSKGLKTQLAGGGLDFKFPTETRFRAEGKHFADTSEDYVNTYLVKARIDQRIDYGKYVSANIHVAGAVMNETWLLTAGLTGNIVPSKTTYNVWFKSQLNESNDNVNPLVSDYDLILGDQAAYAMFGVKIFQGIWKYFAIGGAFEAKFNDKENYGQRDYWRVTGNVDFFGLIPSNYISLTADYWNVEKRGLQSENKRLFFGGRITQVVSDTVDIWAGASLTNYRYHYQQIDAGGFAPVNYFNKKLDDNVYVAYAGAAWSPFEWLNVQADYMYEESELIIHEDSNNYSAHWIELWVNFLF